MADYRFVWSPLPVRRERVRVRVISMCRGSLDYLNHPHPSPLPACREREQYKNGKVYSLVLLLLVIVSSTSRGATTDANLQDPTAQV